MWLVTITVIGFVSTQESSSSSNDLASTVKLLQEQVSALLEHRQEEYNALEDSLKKAMEKNTELIVLKNEVKFLRKEVNILRGGSSNEAKNERLRVRWLGSAVTELQSELAEVLRARNASEEFVERSRMRSEIALLRSDVAEVGRGIRDMGVRMTSLEASFGTVRMDIAAVKERVSQLSRTCADVSSQLSTVQMEMKSTKCDHNSEHKLNHHQLSRNEIQIESKRSGHHTRHSFSRLPATLRHVEERLGNLEHKIAVVARKKSVVEKRVVFEDQTDLFNRIEKLENLEQDLSRRIFNVSQDVSESRKLSESMVQIFESVESLEDKFETTQSDAKREIARLDVNAARKAAELSLTREELGNLKKAVQALSVSASKLQEKSDQQQEAISNLNTSLGKIDLSKTIDKASNITKELEHVEDQYRSMIDALPGNCKERDGLTLLAPGPGAPLLASCSKGWIVVGRRTEGTIDFDRSWNDYATGFGSPVNEFWAGNEALHRLTRDNCTRLKIDLIDIDGTYWQANYEYFTVDSEESGYRLRISGYSGNATDAMSYQNGMAFSAKDRDMDISPSDCAANYRGGWWFSHCQHANLNGRYSLGLTWFRSDINEWMVVASAELSVQKKNQC